MHEPRITIPPSVLPSDRTLLALARETTGSVGRTLEPLAPLLVRLLAGTTFLFTGIGKAQHFQATARFFESLGLPFATANAGFVTGLEIVGGVLLLLGLAVRGSAALLASTMVVALLTADRLRFVEAVTRESNVALTDVAPLVMLALLTSLMVSGSGALGLDAWFARLRRSR